MTTQPLTLSEIANRTRLLVSKHGWEKPESDRPQTARNVAISIALEAAELLKCFQWSESAAPDQVADEIADILIFAAYLADLMKVDLNAAVENKMASNDIRRWPSGLEDAP
jgi:NTP pyrophosphatase (non-canonical NTP hydrolase)